MHGARCSSARHGEQIRGDTRHSAEWETFFSDSQIISEKEKKKRSEYTKGADLHYSIN